MIDAELKAIAHGGYEVLDPLLAAAARFTEEVVKSLWPSNETPAVVVNIVLTIGCYMSIARLVAVTGIESDAETLHQLLIVAHHDQRVAQGQVLPRFSRH